MSRSTRFLNGADKNREFQMIKKFLKNESGANAIEYVLIAAAMAAVLILVMPSFATAISSKFGSITSSVNSVQ